MAKESYSAFGSTEPLLDAPGERIRWCCPQWIDGPDTLQQAIEIARRAGTREGVSRISMRVFSDCDLAKRFGQIIDASGFTVEAAINPEREDGCRISYLAWCSEDRRDVAADAFEERSLVESVVSQPRPEKTDLARDLQDQEAFRLEECSGRSFSDGDAADLVRMHRQNFPRFPYCFEEKLAIMRDNPESYLQVAIRSNRDGKIYAFSNLELNPVRLSSGRELWLAEYDNTMRLNGDQAGHPPADGMGRMLRLKLATLAAARGVDFCYSESRSALVAINQISHQIGMRYGGKLVKHLLIAGKRDIEYRSPSSFESMNVWFFDQATLASLGQAHARTGASP